jgi:hypothetical protein
MPALAGDDENVLAADVRIAVDGPAGVGENRGLLLLAAGVLVGETARELARPPPRLVVPSLHQEQVEREIGRAHASGRVQARRQDEADVEAVERPPGQAALFEQGLDSRGVRPRDRPSSPQRAMTRFSPTSGTTSASVPMAATLTKCGSISASRPLPRAAPAPA